MHLWAHEYIAYLCGFEEANNIILYDMHNFV